jgi:N-acetylglucosamine kinase-like BadF-type ATPase
LTVGSKGIWTAAERESLRRGLQGLAEHVHILSDAELTFESAFTPRGQAPGKTAGILVIAGTGSIALARDNRGRAARAGGLGPKKGDEGSGFWIGREYLRLKSKAKDAAAGPESVARTARLSRRVLKKAGKERACAEILQQAQKHLAGLAVDLAGRLSFAGRIPVCVAGGLFQDSGFQKGFWKALRASSRGRRFIRVSARRDAALAAAQWGGSTLGFPKALWRR